jgi:hypothetical protein
MEDGSNPSCNDFNLSRFPSLVPRMNTMTNIWYGVVARLTVRTK